MRGGNAGAASSLACGSIAGFAATVATYPLDIIRTICAHHESGALVAVPVITFIRRLRVFSAPPVHP